MARPILVVKNLRKKLAGEVVLKDVSFSVDRGEIFIIRGPSGSGKSTLLRCLNRLIEPDGGEIYFEEVSIFDMDPIELRKKVVLVPQVPTMFDGSVEDNLTYALKVMKIEWNEKDLVRTLEKMGLPEHYLGKPAHELSVGEQQRVSIARALLLKPKILLMDEPTSHLDPASTRLIEDLVLRLNREDGISFVIVSHSEEQAKRIGSRVAYLDSGVIKKVEVIEK